jgi:hypothetical protein
MIFGNGLNRATPKREPIVVTEIVIVSVAWVGRRSGRRTAATPTSGDVEKQPTKKLAWEIYSAATENTSSTAVDGNCAPESSRHSSPRINAGSFGQARRHEPWSPWNLSSKATLRAGGGRSSRLWAALCTHKSVISRGTRTGGPEDIHEFEVQGTLDTASLQRSHFSAIFTLTAPHPY